MLALSRLLFGMVLLNFKWACISEAAGFTIVVVYDGSAKGALLMLAEVYMGLRKPVKIILAFLKKQGPSTIYPKRGLPFQSTQQGGTDDGKQSAGYS
jgi:hypothetical protein